MIQFFQYHFQEINKSHEFFAGMVPNPERRTPLCEEASIEYSFGEGLILTDLKASAKLYPSWLYGGLSTPNSFDESKAPIRQPRAWNIVREEDVLRAMEGIKDYDPIIRNYFSGKIPSHNILKDISLEKLLEENFPVVIDSMIDFIEN